MVVQKPRNCDADKEGTVYSKVRRYCLVNELVPLDRLLYFYAPEPHLRAMFCKQSLVNR